MNACLAKLVSREAETTAKSRSSGSRSGSRSLYSALFQACVSAIQGFLIYSINRDAIRILVCVHCRAGVRNSGVSIKRGSTVRICNTIFSIALLSVNTTVIFTTYIITAFILH